MPTTAADIGTGIGSVLNPLIGGNTTTTTTTAPSASSSSIVIISVIAVVVVIGVIGYFMFKSKSSL